MRQPPDRGNWGGRNNREAGRGAPSDFTGQIPSDNAEQSAPTKEQTSPTTDAPTETPADAPAGAAQPGNMPQFPMNGDMQPPSDMQFGQSFSATESQDFAILGSDVTLLMLSALVLLIGIFIAMVYKQ